MATKYESIALDLPSEFVEASCGFSLDIGCSTVKVIYRSKDDYENGKPLKDELKHGTGRVYLAPSITSTEINDVIELIHQKCDIIKTDGQKTEVLTTGAGCNLFQAQLEKGLDISIKNEIEFEYFTKAFRYLSQTWSSKEIFFPQNERAVSDCKKRMEKFSGVFDKMKDVWKLDVTKNEETEKSASVDEEPVFPCVVAMCGSGIGFSKIEEDGTWKVLDGAALGGRTFMGLAALLTGKKDFSKIYASIEKGSCRSVDEYPADLVNVDGDFPDDKYSVFRDFEDEFPAMAFGKAITKDRSQIEDDDILHSLYRLTCLHILQLGHYVCREAETYRLYFCGNLFDNDVARYFMTADHCGKMAFTHKRRIRLEFIRHGGHLGSLGAFMNGQEVKESKKTSVAGESC